jgi:hypothetical protein
VRAWVERQPVVVRLILVIVVVAALRVAALLHWIPADWVVSEDGVQDWLDGLVALAAAWDARRKVTPVAAPRDDAGRTLVPAGSTPLSRREET